MTWDIELRICDFCGAVKLEVNLVLGCVISASSGWKKC